MKIIRPVLTIYSHMAELKLSILLGDNSKHYRYYVLHKKTALNIEIKRGYVSYHISVFLDQYF